MVKLPCQAACLLLLVLMEKRVDSRIDLRPEAVGIVAELLDVLGGIARRRPCSEARGTDIDGIRSVVDGCDAAFEVAGRGEKFNRPPLTPP